LSTIFAKDLVSKVHKALRRKRSDSSTRSGTSMARHVGPFLTEGRHQQFCFSSQLSDNITLWPVAKYFVSAALVFLGLYVQLTITETPVFGKASTRN
jgi:hypothetical protein